MPGWPERLPSTGIPEIVEHYKAIIRSQAEAPVLIGHSFGGLIVQLLLDQGYGAAGVAISSVPPRGVAPVRIFSRRTLKQLRTLFRWPSSWRQMLPPPALQPEALAGLQPQLVAESGRIFWQLFSAAAEVDFENHQRAPLLLVACGQDHCVPSGIQQRNFARYRGSRARTDFVSFAGLSHYSIAEPGREALAAYCASWARQRLQDGELDEVEEMTA